MLKIVVLTIVAIKFKLVELKEELRKKGFLYKCEDDDEEDDLSDELLEDFFGKKKSNNKKKNTKKNTKKKNSLSSTILNTTTTSINIATSAAIAPASVTTESKQLQSSSTLPFGNNPLAAFYAFNNTTNNTNNNSVVGITTHVPPPTTVVAPPSSMYSYPGYIYPNVNTTTGNGVTTTTAPIEKDPYKILGVPKTATKEEIKKKFKELAKKYHPDINKAADAKEKFAELNGAYQILVDDNKRRMYDMTGSTEEFPGGGGPGGFEGDPFGMGGRGMSQEQAEEIFNQFFGRGGPFGGDFESAFGESAFGGMGGRAAKGPRHGSDVQ
ncbi:hypothetical protein ABK040_014833 [Willaertia magna]